VEERDRLAERFEEQRGQLRAVAYRMLGSPSEAEDAVQEAWLRLARIDTAEVDSLPAWLRTVVTRICLDMLRSRAARREKLTGTLPDGARPAGRGPSSTPDEQVVLADSVSRALLVVLDTLDPPERIAFVLHDMFGVPFAQIAPIVERTPTTTKKLASRARQKVRGTPAVPAAQLAEQRDIVLAFLKAARNGDLAGVLNVLAPDVVRRADAAALPPGAAAVVRGAQAVAEGTMRLAARARLAELALVDGEVGAVVIIGGRLWIALTFTVENGKIAGYSVIADPARLRNLSLAALDWPAR
jgi:RNA polymerase sigma-70 factor (ECF subfamily)